MRVGILNTATTEQMGCIICFFFRLLPNLQIRIYKSMRSIVCSSILCRFVYPVRISVKAPSPVTLQAVPKLSCNAKIVSINAVPESPNPRTPVISPKDAITVPPGTPGAPIANTPRSTQKRIIVPGVGTVS